MPNLLQSMVTAVGLAPQSYFACGIISSKSGGCSENCAFCAQSAHYRCDVTANAATSPLTPLTTLLCHAETLATAGLAYIGLVASGRQPAPGDIDYYCHCAREIKAKVAINLCGSFGLLSYEQACQLKDAGFTSYHHNLETSRRFFPVICSSHDYDQRMTTVSNARRAGLRICSGGIFGIGENVADRQQLAVTLRDLQVDAVPVNFLTPVPGTPLADQLLLSPAEALEIITLLRGELPGKDIIIAGGRPGVLGRFDCLSFAAGANGLMTGDYLTTCGGKIESDFAIFTALGITPQQRLERSD